MDLHTRCNLCTLQQLKYLIGNKKLAKCMQVCGILQSFNQWHPAELYLKAALITSLICIKVIVNTDLCHNHAKFLHDQINVQCINSLILLSGSSLLDQVLHNYAIVNLTEPPLEIWVRQ